MQKASPDSQAAPSEAAHHAAGHATNGQGHAADGQEDNSELIATVTTVGIVGVGAAVFEAALLPGLVLGVAAMWAPKYFPQMGAALQPLLRSSVRGVYKLGQKTREVMAEAQEQVHDIVAEVHAESDVAPQPPKRTKTAAATPAP